MNITVRFYGIAYDITRRRELALSLEENATVSDLFKLMIKDYPDLRDLSFDEFSNFRDYLSVAINNVDIQGLKGTNTPLKDGDTILVMPPIGGG